MTRIGIVYSGVELYEEIHFLLKNDPDWQISESGEKFAKNYQVTDVCVSLARTKVDTDTQILNSEITIMTLLDDNCFTSFTSLESRFGE